MAYVADLFDWLTAGPPQNQWLDIGEPMIIILDVFWKQVIKPFKMFEASAKGLSNLLWRSMWLGCHWLWAPCAPLHYDYALAIPWAISRNSV